MGLLEPYDVGEVADHHDAGGNHAQRVEADDPFAEPGSFRRVNGWKFAQLGGHGRIVAAAVLA